MRGMLMIFNNELGMIMHAFAFEMENLQREKNVYKKLYQEVLNIYHHFLAMEPLLALKKSLTSLKYVLEVR